MGARVGEEGVGGMEEEEVRGFRERWWREGWERRVREEAWTRSISSEKHLFEDSHLRNRPWG